MFPVALIIVAVSVGMFTFTAKSFMTTEEKIASGQKELETQSKVFAAKQVKMIKIEAKLDELRKDEARLIQKTENARALVSAAESSILKEAKIKGEAKAEVIKAQSILNSAKEAELLLIKTEAKVNELQASERKLVKSVKLKVARQKKLDQQEQLFLALKKDIDRLSDKKGNLTVEVEQQAKDIEERQAKRDAIVAQMAILNGKLNSVKSLLSVQTAEFDAENKLKASIAAKTEVLRELDKTVAGLAKKRAALKSETTTLMERAQELKARISTDSVKVERNNELKASIAVKESQNAMLDSVIARLEVQLKSDKVVYKKALNESITDLARKESDLKSSMKVLEAKMMREKQEHSRLSTLVAKLKGEEQGLNEVVTQLEEKEKELKTNVKHLKNTVPKEEQ